VIKSFADKRTAALFGLQPNPLPFSSIDLSPLVAPAGAIFLPLASLLSLLSGSP
jgi:hypothetical protein